ncbi:Psmd10 [Symbiodinium sp. KB8]|nr:Psmd10 [Symbiodinium sp. KB8]
MELLPVLLEVLQFSAWLPSDEEFTAIWGTILHRLATDWDESAFEQYIRANLLHVEGLLQQRHGLQEPATLMLDVCLVLRSRLNAGVYSDMCHVLDEPWRALQTGAKTTWAAWSVEQDGDDSEVELEQRSKRLSLDDILKHFRKHGARGTFLASVTSRVLSDGRQARLLYVLPKYRLELGINRREDIAAAVITTLCATCSFGAKAKQSQRLRNMLRLSPPKSADSTAAAQVLPNPRMDAAARMQLLPGALAHGAHQPMVRLLAVSEVKESETRCMACNKRGQRCKNKRTDGNCLLARLVARDDLENPCKNR